MRTEAEMEGHSHKPSVTWTPRSWRGRKDPPPEPPEGAWPCDPWVSDSGLQTVRE